MKNLCDIKYAFFVIWSLFGLLSCESFSGDFISESEKGITDKSIVFELSFKNSDIINQMTDSKLFGDNGSQAKVIFSYHGSDGITHSSISDLYFKSGTFFTDPLSLVFPDTASLTLTKLIITDKNSAKSIYYSSMAVNSNEGEKRGVGCLPASILISEKENADTCKLEVSLIDIVQTLPQACGYQSWTDDCMRPFEIAYSVNICGDPCELLDGDSQKKHAIANSQMKIQRQEFQDNKWVSVDDVYCVKSGEGQLGIMKFDNYLFLSDEEERYLLTLVLENEVEIEAIVNLQDLLIPSQSGFWETPAGSEVCTGYIHFDLCDVDLTQESLVQKNAKWAFKVTKPKNCIGE